MKKEDKKRLTKELLKEWQRTHYQEYCDFSDMMHDRNGVGFDKVYAEAVMMIPKFEKALFLYLKNDRSENIDDLETLLKNEAYNISAFTSFLRPTPGQLHACNAFAGYSLAEASSVWWSMEKR